MEDGSRRPSYAEKLAVETGRPVFVTETTEVIHGSVEPDEDPVRAAIKTGRSVVVKVTTDIKQ